MDIELLSRMIGELIVDHDQVGLPGVGTFVAEVVPASFSDKGYTINPPYRRLSFHPSRLEDQLLINYYAKANDIPIEMAKLIIVQFLAEFKTVLKDRKTISLPGLGRLRATRENNFFFVADEDLDIYPEGFSLKPVSLKTHIDTRDPVHIPVESFMKNALAAQNASDEFGSKAEIFQNQVVAEPKPAVEVHFVDLQSGESVPETAAVAAALTVPAAVAVATGSEVAEEQVAEAIPAMSTVVESPVETEPIVEAEPAKEPAIDLAAEPVAIQPEEIVSVESIVEKDIQSIDESALESLAEPMAPVAEPAAEHVVETEPTAEPTPEPAAEPSAEPAAESVVETEPAPEPTPEPSVEPVAEPAAEPVVETEPAPEPTPEPAAEPVAESAAEQQDSTPSARLVTPKPLMSEEDFDKKSSHWWILPVVLVALAIIAFAAYIILVSVAPDFIDSILYTPEELRIINY